MKRKEVKATDIWSEEKNKSLGDFIISHSEKQTKERKLKNELLSIQYQIEDYIESDEITKEFKILDFLKLYLKTLNITQRKLANLFEMKDSNLHKYLVGERKLNAKIVLKLSHFTHLNPEYWLRIEVKNELIQINKEETKEYQKYDYQNLLTA